MSGQGGFPEIPAFSETSAAPVARTRIVHPGENLRIRLSATQSLALQYRGAREALVASSAAGAIPKGSARLSAAIGVALDEALGRSLADAVDSQRPVIIVVDDHTRGTPVAAALDALFPRLAALGIRDDQMAILVSSGTHRPMSQAEIAAKVGAAGSRLEIIHHDCTDADSLYTAGRIDDIPVRLNRRLRDAGTVIGIGSVVAHKFSGWSGCAKLICPGVAGYETIFRCHYRSIVEENIVPGLRQNWFRSFIDRVGELAGLSFCLGFVPAAGGTLGVAAGEPAAVFDRCIAMARRSMAVRFPGKADLVVACAWPATMDLWQSGKGFYSGDLLVRDGGTLVLATPLDEGLGDHPDFIALLGHSPETILNLLAAGNLADPLAAVASYAIRRIAERCTVRIVTDNASLQGYPLLGHAITDDIQPIADRALAGGDSVMAVLDDSYVLPVPG